MDRTLRGSLERARDLLQEARTYLQDAIVQTTDDPTYVGELADLLSDVARAEAGARALIPLAADPEACPKCGGPGRALYTNACPRCGYVYTRRQP